MYELSQPRVEMRRNETVAMATHGSDQGLYVEFRMAPAPHPDLEKSEEAGYPVYDDIPWIKIMYPGDRTKVTDRPAKLKKTDQTDTVPPDTVRFREQWEAFQDMTKKATSGFPIEEWQLITRSEGEFLKAQNIHTVEQMASLPDVALTWLGARRRRDEAIAWIDSAKGHAVESKLARENEQLKSQIEALTAQMHELADKVGEPLEAPKRRGRPPKHEE